MKNYYVLRVLDWDDSLCYTTLVYESLEDCNKAREIIEQVDKYWYSAEFEENEQTCDGYYEYLIIKLKENNLYNDGVCVDEIFVR